MAADWICGLRKTELRVTQILNMGSRIMVSFKEIAKLGWWFFWKYEFCFGNVEFELAMRHLI